MEAIKMLKNVSILADSLNVVTGDRATTFLLHRFPKCLQAELNTHRVMARNSASSRAVPVRKMIERILEDPYIPTFTANQAGMVGCELDDGQYIGADLIWAEAKIDAIVRANQLGAVGVHKDMANRLLEPFMRIPIIVTPTEWSNFFKLRTAENVQPDFRAIAIEMEKLREENKPVLIEPGQWHIPFLEPLGKAIDDKPLKYYLIFSAARCAWISYASHDGDRSFEKASSTHDKLIADLHRSPFEHQLVAGTKTTPLSMTRNFRGFIPYRHFVENNLDLEWKAS